VYRPLRWSEWAKNPHAEFHGIGFADAWALTREILRDHTSHSWHALAKSAYVPTAAEMALWDELAMSKKLRKKTYRPWTDSRNDAFRPTHRAHLLTAEQKRGRELLKEKFHIQD
jgi:hypothetical protein